MIRKEIAAFTIRPDIRCCASGCTVADICVPAHDVILMIMEEENEEVIFSTCDDRSYGF